MFNSIQNKILSETVIFVKDYMKKYDESHDFNHVLRVKNIATKIAIEEKMSVDDIFEIQLGALTHDLDDHKYNKIFNAQETLLKKFFETKINDVILKNVIEIACNVSLSKEISQRENGIIKICKKLHCVQDADRIDSLGAIGVSRYFIYGIKNNQSKLNDIMINMENRTKKLIGLIKTESGKNIAMKKYLVIDSFIQDYKESII